MKSWRDSVAPVRLQAPSRAGRPQRVISNRAKSVAVPVIHEGPQALWTSGA
jgi:hypothetical protein